MSRKTRCLTYGAWAHRCERVETSTGHAIICMSDPMTLCGKDDDDAESPPFDMLIKARPKHVCVACWKKYREDMKEAEL